MQNRCNENGIERPEAKQVVFFYRKKEHRRELVSRGLYQGTSFVRELCEEIINFVKKEICMIE